jgi:hypothetical protein
MPFELYASKVRTERGEEAVNAWLETMKKKTRWRIMGEGDDAWIDDRAEAERAVAARCFDKAYEEVRTADVSGAIPAANLSPSLLMSLKIAGTQARNHPAILIPAVCRAVEAEHLPVFKRQGKLHTGPARPNPLPLNQVLAERPAQMVAWIRENKPAKLEGLWKSVLPEGSTAPPAEYAADLFWLLHQGHILLYTDDTLAVQEAREAGAAEAGDAPKKAKKKKKKSKKAKPAGEAITAEETPDATAGETPTEARSEVSPPPASDVPDVEAAPAEQPAPEQEFPVTAAAEEAVSGEPEEEHPHPFVD